MKLEETRRKLESLRTSNPIPKGQAEKLVASMLWEISDMLSDLGKTEESLETSIVAKSVLGLTLNPKDCWYQADLMRDPVRWLGEQPNNTRRHAAILGHIRLILRASGYMPQGERLLRVANSLDIPNPTRVASLFSARKAAQNLPQKVKDALRRHVQENDRDAISSIKEDLIELSKDKGLKHLLEPQSEFCYRYVDATDKDLFELLVGKTPKEGSYGKKGKGTLKPKDESGISSWTTNPRSFIYSGFFNRVHPKSGLMLFKARVDSNNFLGNPENLYAALNVKVGHSFEREVIGLGPIDYEVCVYGELRKQQSVEGLANDLAEMLLPLEEVEFNDDYYIPNT